MVNLSELKKQAEIDAIKELKEEYKNTPYIDKIIEKGEKTAKEMGFQNLEEAYKHYFEKNKVF